MVSILIVIDLKFGMNNRIDLLVLVGVKMIGKDGL